MGTTMTEQQTVSTSAPSLAKLPDGAISPGPTTACRAVVLEGNPVHRAVLARMLAHCGFTCRMPESAEDAVKACGESSRTVALIDCDSAEIDGYGVVSALRQSESAVERTPVIALTSATSQAARRKRKAAGFDNYIEKPFRLPRVASILAPYGLKATDANGSQPVSTLDGGVVAELCEMAQDEPAFLRDLVSLFVATAQRQLDHLRRAEEDSDAARLTKVASGLRTISGQMGVVRLRDTCAIIETLAGSGVLGGVGALVGEASLAFERAGCDLRSMEVDFLLRRQSTPGAGGGKSPKSTGPWDIMVAEGDPLLARFLQTSLSASGFVVTLVDAGRAVLSALREKRFDAVILDAALPEIDGYALLSTLRRESGLERLPVMILSPRTMEQDVLRAFELGADEYAAKPFNLLELVARLRALLRRR
jgi:DNA-binding response OmpR family regulator/HPt (histidine-containing phosphotransfer) domain-containing protein